MTHILVRRRTLIRQNTINTSTVVSEHSRGWYQPRGQFLDGSGSKLPDKVKNAILAMREGEAAVFVIRRNRGAQTHEEKYTVMAPIGEPKLLTVETHHEES